MHILIRKAKPRQRSKSDVTYISGRSVGSVAGSGTSNGQALHISANCQICAGSLCGA